MKVFSRIRRPKGGIFHLVLLGGMLLLNNALPQNEPLGFALYFSAVAVRGNPFVLSLSYLFSALLALSWEALLCAASQAGFLLVVALFYARAGKRMGSERFAYALLAQLPFTLLYPHSGYSFLPLAPVWQKAIFSVAIALFTVATDGALRALLFRAFRCRLSTGALAEICLLATALGLGFMQSFGALAYSVVGVSALFFCALLLKNPTAFPVAVALALPPCLTQGSALPLATFTLFACAPLLALPYGRMASGLALFACIVGEQYLGGAFALPVGTLILRLCAYFIPLLVLALLPNAFYRRLERSMLFYKKRVLPRVAINRNRRAVGEQLYEVSALFREIGNSFLEEDEPAAPAYVRDSLVEAVCKSCPRRKACHSSPLYEDLLRLIAVGCAKGKVSLVDLPETVAGDCPNSAGILFTLNQRLVEYRRYMNELDNARAGRRLLSEQALGVSEILRNIALEQSEEYAFSQEEDAIQKALAAAGILSSELFAYGEGDCLTVSLTAAEGVNVKRLTGAVSEALNASFSLAEKIPLTADLACYVLRRSARFDGAFGIASLPKAGTEASGDTHSLLKIDEKRFLVALSDGMGSGESARAVSDRTLSLLESFYKAKMPSEVILSTVNRLLSFSADESFSCLDLAAVDLQTGMVDVVKIGSPVGFILTAEKLRVLEGESLPIGVLEQVRPATIRAQLNENDFLIFMSDGVTSAFNSTALYHYLSELHPLNPQSLAENILSAALERYGGVAEDDMTVLAVRLTAKIS